MDYARYCDCFTVLTEAMKEPLNIEDLPFTVIDRVLCLAGYPEDKDTVVSIYRLDNELLDVKEKVYTRDLYRRD